MKAKIARLLAVLFACSLFASAAHATVLRVVTVETENVPAYVKEIQRGQALLKKLGSTAVLHVWRARFAGSDAGNVVVSIEYADLAAFAAEDKKLSTEPEYQAWLKGLNNLRKIVSDSLYDELTAP